MKFFLAAALALAAATQAQAKFLPDNNLDLEDNLEATRGIDQAQFDAVINRAEAIYKPMVSRFGARLTVVRRFSDSTVNAFAEQPTDTDWRVTMFGGLARRPEVTADGFAMVLCHEIGHHLAGYPFVQDWAANEGQSDIYATGACAAKVFAADQALSLNAQLKIPPAQKAKCDAASKASRTRDICYRAVVAGKSLADLLAALEGSRISFDTPDTSVVRDTDDLHPAAQCRLDTYVAGALCGATRWDYSLIPGKRFADRNGASAEAEAFGRSCTIGAGARPKCWFASVRGEE